MSPPKGFYSFLDFNYTNGAIDLFEQTLRNSIDFNAMEDDVFEARVLTTPTKIVDNIANAGPIDVTDDDLNVKYAFRARILGPLSPHRFIEDPCELSNFQEEGAKERAFSVIQDHTKVVLYGPQDNPVIGDVVRIKLERTGKTYNTKDAKQYLGLVRSTTIPVKRVSGESCATLAEIFNGVDFNSLAGSVEKSVNNTLDGLNPNFKEKLTQLLEKLKNKGYSPRVYETLRTNERQSYLFSIGASKIQHTGNHGRGTAADIIDGRGHPDRAGQIVAWGSWEGEEKRQGRKPSTGDIEATKMATDFFDALGAAAVEVGLTWGGHWNFVDKPHVELKGGVS